jgi:hypothetical protein
MNVGDLVKAAYAEPPYLGIIVNVQEGRDAWGIPSNLLQDSEYDILFAGHTETIRVFRCEIVEVTSIEDLTST